MCDTPIKRAQKSFAILSLEVSRDMKNIGPDVMQSGFGVNF